MADAKHTAGFTPGPWFAEQSTADYWYITLSEKPSGPVIAQTWMAGPHTHQQEANARLMASAPLLLAALEAADEALANVTAFESDARYIMGNTNFEIVQQRRKDIRAALSHARATGEG